jgi:uncharacterized protein (DUF1330 family)
LGWPPFEFRRIVIGDVNQQGNEATMKIRHTIALSMLAGMAVGAVAIQGLHAQAKPPVYMIGQIDVSNADGYAKEYLPPAQASIKAHGGVYVAAGPGTVIEGAPAGTRFIILRWDSLEQLKGWRDSPEYTAAHKAGEKYAKFTVVAVNGTPQ